MNLSLPTAGFQCPTALLSLRELVRWLALRQQWEESVSTPTCDCVARHWTVLPHDDEVYVELVTGMDGQGLLHRFPGLSTLPVMPGNRVPVISGVQCRGQTFYFGPFSQEHGNL